MVGEADVPPLARALIAARRALDLAERSGSRFDGLPVSGHDAPRDAAAAYAVQDAVAREFQWFGDVRPAAWKVGAATRAATPEAAPLPGHGVVPSPGALDARRFTTIGVEGELAFRLRAAPDAVAAVDDAIGELVVTLEIVAPRFRDLAAMPPLLRLADQGVHGALVVGTGIRWSGPIDWANQVAIVRRDGVVVAKTRGGHPLGDLRFLLAWLAYHAASRGFPLAAGDVVTAGTWTGLVAVQPGQSVAIEFPGIGSASLALPEIPVIDPA